MLQSAAIWRASAWVTSSRLQRSPQSITAGGTALETHKPGSLPVGHQGMMISRSVEMNLRRVGTAHLSTTIGSDVVVDVHPTGSNSSDAQPFFFVQGTRGS